MSRKALLIGINYFGTDSELNGCINDINNIKKFLEQNYGLKDEEVKILSDDQKDVENQPTKANIIRHLHWLVEGAIPESKLFFHYSGHGSHIKDTSGDENDGEDECICPVDYMDSGFIKDDTLKRIMVDPLPKGCNLFAIFDCCHSGTILDLRFNYLFHKTKGKKKNRREIIEMNLERKIKASTGDVCMISGCLDDQYSSDYWDRNKKAFAGALTNSFLKTYDQLKSSNRKINNLNLMRLLHRHLKKGGFDQNTKLSTGKLTKLTKDITIF